MRPHLLLLLTCTLTATLASPSAAATPPPHLATEPTSLPPTGIGRTTPGTGQAITGTSHTGVGHTVTGSHTVTHPTTARPSTPGTRLSRLTKPSKPSLTPHLKPHREINKVLLLAIAKGEAPTPADHAALLQCSPPAGTHPKRDAACRLLDPVHADLNELNADPKATCSRDYNPVTVYATGLWDTARLSYEHTFNNPCELRATMGAVFELTPK